MHPDNQNPPYPGAQIPVAKAIPCYLGYPPLEFNRQFPFVATLEFPDLTHLTNDPISHSPWWLVIPIKFPSDIPKFNGNPGEDPSTHIMTYHLWCYSNSLNDESICLHVSTAHLPVRHQIGILNYHELHSIISTPYLPHCLVNLVCPKLLFKMSIRDS